MPFNPLFLYGGVGLGKTHLMHAIANHAQARDSEARVAYVHSERFVSDMVRGLQHNKVCVAIARELAGFIWSIGQQVTVGS